MQEQMPFMVCLTGGVASGKTFISDFFSKRGVDIVDTDVLARKVVGPGSEGLHAIIEEFGESVVVNGELDRKAMRSLVFSDGSKRIRLNEITHPLIHQEVLAAIKLSKSEILVVVIPLFAGQSNYQFFDRICVIDVGIETQLSRLQKRDGISSVLASKMVSSQIDRESRLKLADDVIVNNGSLPALQKSSEALLSFYRELID